MVPVSGLIVHVTALDVALLTVAENCCVWAAVRVIELGVTDTPTDAGAVSRTVAVPVVALSNVLVAVTVTVLDVVMTAGAVYSPLAASIVPAPLTLQVTPVWLIPKTCAVNCCDCPAFRVTVAGLIWMVKLGGWSVI